MDKEMIIELKDIFKSYSEGEGNPKRNILNAFNLSINFDESISLVGPSGCEAVRENLENQIKINKINFVIVNGENSADQGVGITEKISKDFFNCGVDVITSGNHIWDERETMEFISSEKRLLRPENLIKGSL